ncbi:MAG: SDR family oxidoreductase [Salinibacterium sp.]|nr:SDR family oxidoreductase [Salinibacterium sp.]
MDVTFERIDSDGDLSAGGLLSSRRFLVTGGARGIGAAIVANLAAHGADGAVIDMHLEGAEPSPWPAIAADVTDEARMLAATRSLIDEAGPFDGLVAAAGIVPTWHSPSDIDLEDFDRTMSVNVRGFVVALKSLVPSMPAGSTVVAIGSLNSWRGDPHLLSYAASKHAVVGVVRSAALALGPKGIRVNAVAPGPIATAALLGRIDARTAATGRARDEALQASADLTALGTLASTTDVANAVLFLSSHLSSSTTGHLLPVDSGLL